jgi:hypothetical protein
MINNEKEKNWNKKKLTLSPRMFFFEEETHGKNLRIQESQFPGKSTLSTSRRTRPEIPHESAACVGVSALD